MSEVVEMIGVFAELDLGAIFVVLLHKERVVLLHDLPDLP